MQRYRKKPVVVEAMRLHADKLGEVRDWVIAGGGKWYVSGDHLGEVGIGTLEGTMWARVHTGDEADWIVRGTRGEFYPCKPGPFVDTFEEVAE